MEEQELKTSVKQRVIISIIALILVGSFIASYAAIVISGSKSSSSTPLSEEKMAAYEQGYSEAVEAFKTATADDYAVFAPYLSEVKGYNEESAQAGLATRDLLTGSGRELTDGDTNYMAYYVGFCADESVFDSSLDDASEPTMFARLLDVSEVSGMIAGWDAGVVGMRLGGVREITIPGELAYGETREICGGTNKPLKFIVMTIDKSEGKKTLYEELYLASMKLQYAQYGIDYDAMVTEEEGSGEGASDGSASGGDTSGGAAEE